MKSVVHHAALWPAPVPGIHAVLMHSDRGFGRHWHDSFGFGVMDEGGHRSASGRGPVMMAPGNLITVNPGEVHDGVPLQHTARRWRMVHLSPEAIAALLGSPAPEFTRPAFDDPKLRSAVDRLFQCWAAWRAHSSALTRGAWEEALAQVSGEMSQRHGTRCSADAAPVPLNPVRECLLDRLDAPPNLAELASLAGLSRFQLVRQFSRAHGLPPFAWLLQERLRRARALIARGLTLADAAAACGFADQSHLHRHFLRSYGYTPGVWQRASRLAPLQ